MPRISMQFRQRTLMSLLVPAKSADKKSSNYGASGFKRPQDFLAQFFPRIQKLLLWCTWLVGGLDGQSFRAPSQRGLMLVMAQSLRFRCRRGGCLRYRNSRVYLGAPGLDHRMQSGHEVGECRPFRDPVRWGLLADGFGAQESGHVGRERLSNEGVFRTGRYPGRLRISTSAPTAIAPA